MDNKQMILNIS